MRFCIVLVLSVTTLSCSEETNLRPGSSGRLEGKGDSTFALTPVQDTLPNGLPRQQIFTSAASYRAYFGHDALDVDFAQDWVVLYSAGAKPTGGYVAQIRSVTEIPGLASAPGVSGLYTLVVGTELESPGEDCASTDAITIPHALVKFPIPPYVTSGVRYDHKNTVASCDACAGMRLPDCIACPEGFFRECGQSCSGLGASCSNEIGDSRTCTNGQWLCTPHAPLGTGCNKVCESRPDGACAAIEGKDFWSVEGHATTSDHGAQTVFWKLHFEGERFAWTKGDAGQVGSYRCYGRAIETIGSLPIAADYDVQTQTLTWNGAVYRAGVPCGPFTICDSGAVCCDEIRGECAPSPEMCCVRDCRQ